MDQRVNLNGRKRIFEVFREITKTSKRFEYSLECHG